MATIQHHPSSDLLLSYSAGSLPRALALCVATHLEFCGSCRITHQRNNAIGGELLSEFDESNTSRYQVNTIEKTRLMEMLDTKTDKPEDSEAVAKVALVPRPLRTLIKEGFEQLPWKFASLAVRNCFLFDEENSGRVSLLKIKPGGKVGKHGHLGDEYTIILTGSFSDEDGVYRTGDFMLRDKRHEHTPVATKDRECICLTLQEGPLQFTDRLLSWLNPLLRRGFDPV